MVYKENPKVEFNSFSIIERYENSISKERVKVALNTASKSKDEENIINKEGSKVQQNIEKDDKYFSRKSKSLAEYCSKTQKRR